MILIDTLSYTSRLRQVNPGEKFAFCMLTLIFCVVSRSLAVAGVVLAATGFLTVRRGGIPLSRYLSLLRIPAVFLLLCSAAVMVNLSRTPLNAFALPIGSWYLTGSEEEILAGFRLALTALSAVSCLYFLALSTPPPDLLYLGKKLHVPGLILELMLLIYRYLFLLLFAASAITTAQESRLGNHNLRASLRSFSQMAGTVFLLALRRSNALYDAMESRCYDGEIRVLSLPRRARPGEVALIFCFELILLALTLAARH